MLPHCKRTEKKSNTKKFSSEDNDRMWIQIPEDPYGI